MVEYNLGKVRGEDGKGIESINKIDTTDNVDTYEIQYTNGDTQTYTVTNGRDGTAGNIDDNVTQNSQNPVKSSGIYTALTGKANTVHTHTKSEISDFTHSHSISDVTNLQTSLDSKANSSDLGAVATSNDYSDLDNIPSSFTPSSHTHGISDVTDLQTNLNAKVNTSDIANNLTTTTSGKVLDARQGKALADLIGDAIVYINQ